MLEIITTGLFIMLAWGTGDYILATLAKRNGPYQINFWNALVSMIMFAAAYFYLFYPATVLKEHLWLLAVMPILGVAAYVCFLKSLEGHVSLAIAISSGYGVMAMLLSTLLLGETLTNTQYAGIAATTLGLLMTTLNLGELRMLKLKSEVKGIKYAIAALLLWGIDFTIFRPVVRGSDWLTPFFLYSPLSLGLAYAVYSARRKPNEKLAMGKRDLALVVIVTLVTQGAFLLYSYSLQKHPSALMAPISAAYPAVTILLAHIFMKERMEKLQYAGVAMIMAGLIIAAV